MEVDMVEMFFWNEFVLLGWTNIGTVSLECSE